MGQDATDTIDITNTFTLIQTLTILIMAGFGCCAYPHGTPSTKLSEEEQILAAKFARARAAGPRSITEHASIAEFNRAEHTLKILHVGTNKWTCFPGNENEIGNVPMCADPMGLIWLTDIARQKPAPSNPAPGLIYMLSGATQHSNTDPFDERSKPIPIGPHYMITWPFDSKRDGLPNDVRDAGAWVMFDGTPYAYLHVCGSPWAGNVYHPEKYPDAIWTMQYHPSNE